MADQLEIFKIKEPWKKDKERWWSMHNFEPKEGMIVLITKIPHHFLEGNVLRIDKINEKITVQVRKYPECPWIETEILELNYYRVDPILYDNIKSKTVA